MILKTLLHFLVILIVIRRLKCATIETWCRHQNKYLGGYSSGQHNYNTLDQAQRQCLTRQDCGGVTYEPYTSYYTLRRGYSLGNSPSGEISWKRCSQTIIRETTPLSQFSNATLLPDIPPVNLRMSLRRDIVSVVGTSPLHTLPGCVILKWRSTFVL
ncbi:hypothetical protein ACHWQZ_G016602 [Mnemiopsis leidyi]